MLSPASSLSPLLFLFLFTELVVNYSVSRCASLLISAAGESINDLSGRNYGRRNP